MANNIALTAVIKAKDEASQVFNNVEKSSGNLMGGLLKLGAAAGAAGLAIGVASVKVAADFEKSMANISTIVDTNTESMTEMGNQVLELSKKLPVTISDLTAGLYDIRSAGVAASDAMVVLEKSAMLGVTGLGTTEEAVNIATSAINAFGISGEKVPKIFDTIQVAVDVGKTTIAELAHSFGIVAGVADTAEVSFEELMAATGVLTTTGLNASVAQTQLRAAILAIQAPTADMTDLIQKMGFSSGSAMLKEIGLVNSMDKIKAAANGDIEILKKAYGSVQALGAALSLTGELGDNFVDTLKAIEVGEGALDAAFKKQNETASAQYQILKNNLDAEMINLGNKILPRIIDKMPELIKLVEGLSTVFLGVADAVLWITDRIGDLFNLIDKFADFTSKGLSKMTGVPLLEKTGVLKLENVGGYAGSSELDTINKNRKTFGGVGIGISDYNKMEDTVLDPFKKNSTIINLDLRGSTVTDEQITDKITSNLMKNIGFSQLAK